jgi:TPR repeat protein
LSRAQELIRNGDISSARLMLEKALSAGSADAAFQLAETYDPQVLAGWHVRGIVGDPARAKQLYTKASESGVRMAEERLKGLN